jgi:hypothetical protein
MVLAVASARAAADGDGALDTQVSPLFMNADGGLNIGSDTDALVASILAQRDVPPQSLWLVFREEFANLAARLKETAAVSAEAKKELQKLHHLPLSFIAASDKVRTR